MSKTNKERPKCSTIRDEEFNRNFANNFKNIRLSKNLTQANVADKLNTSIQSISAYEKGTCLPSIKNLIHVAHIFGITVDELLSFYKIKEEDIMDDSD